MNLTESNKSLFLIPFLSLSVLVGIFMFSLDKMLESWVYDRSEQELVRLAQVTLDGIERTNASADEMEIVADSVGLATSYMRVSIIDPQGHILGDSFYNLVDFENLLQQDEQPEIKQALEQGKATSIRLASYLNEEALYYAERFYVAGNLGVIRISMPVKAVNQTINALRFLLLGFYLAAVLALALFIAAFSRVLKASIAKEQSLLEKRVEERTTEIEMLQRLASMLAACNSIDEVQQVLSEIVPKVIGEFPCAVSLVNDKGHLIETKIEWPNRWPGLNVFTSDECWALRKGRYHISKDAHSSLTCQHMDNNEEQTLCVPLLAHGQAIGLLHVLLANKQADMNLIFTLSEHLGLALANLNMQEKLREQAIKDPLTKLYNRRYMDDMLERELNRCQRHKVDMSILILDIDHFKPFNDNFGHDAGDYVLQTLAKSLTTTIRKEDLACRIGGEEFALILPETDVKAAQVCAEKINQYVKSEELHFHGNYLGRVTVSIGIAGYGLHGKDAVSLLKSADVALYAAKEAGRDQCKVAHYNETQNVTEISSGKKQN